MYMYIMALTVEVVTRGHQRSPDVLRWLPGWLEELPPHHQPAPWPSRATEVVAQQLAAGAGGKPSCLSRCAAAPASWRPWPEGWWGGSPLYPVFEVKWYLT